MTPQQKILMNQLSDLIKEKFGSIRRFCEIYGYKYRSVVRIMSGKAAGFDHALYDIMRAHALDSSVVINSEMALLQHIMGKVGIDNFCAVTRMRKATVLRVMTEQRITKYEFIKMAYKVYREYLYGHEDVGKYINQLAPGKYLNRSERIANNFLRLKKERQLTRM